MQTNRSAGSNNSHQRQYRVNDPIGETDTSKAFQDTGPVHGMSRIIQLYNEAIVKDGTVNKNRHMVRVSVSSPPVKATTLGQSQNRDHYSTVANKGPNRSTIDYDDSHFASQEPNFRSRVGSTHRHVQNVHDGDANDISPIVLEETMLGIRQGLHRSNIKLPCTANHESDSNNRRQSRIRFQFPNETCLLPGRNEEMFDQHFGIEEVTGTTGPLTNEQINIKPGGSTFSEYTLNSEGHGYIPYYHPNTCSPTSTESAFLGYTWQTLWNVLTTIAIIIMFYALIATVIPYINAGKEMEQEEDHIPLPEDQQPNRYYGPVM